MSFLCWSNWQKLPVKLADNIPLNITESLGCAFVRQSHLLVGQSPLNNYRVLLTCTKSLNFQEAFQQNQLCEGQALFCRETGGSNNLCQGREAVSSLEGLQGCVGFSILR